jgi:hypothetical protein
MSENPLAKITKNCKSHGRRLTTKTTINPELKKQFSYRKRKKKNV